MKLTQKITTEKEIELPDYPFFVKEDNHFLAFMSENCVVSVYTNTHSISEYPSIPVTLDENWQFTTVDEFNAALLVTFDNIKNKINN